MGWMTEVGKAYGNGLDVAAFSGVGPHTAPASAGLITVSHTSAVTLTLPPVASAKRMVVLGNIGSGSATLDGNSSETINGAASMSLGANSGCILYNTGSGWVAAAGGGGTSGGGGGTASSVTPWTNSETQSGTTFSITKNITVCSSTGAASATLPAASAGVGFPYTIYKSASGGSVSIYRAGSDTLLGGSSPYVLTNQYESVTLTPVGVNWIVV